MPSLSIGETKAALAAGAVLVDARTSRDFSAKHIEGSISLPAGSSAAVCDAASFHIQKSRTIVVYCKNSGCGYSFDVAYRLLSIGYTDVRIFEGAGMNGQAPTHSSWRCHGRLPTRTLLLAGRLLLGAVFLLTGLSKLTMELEFLRQVLDYRIVPLAIAPEIAMMLPPLEICWTTIAFRSLAFECILHFRGSSLALRGNTSDRRIARHGNLLWVAGWLVSRDRPGEVYFPSRERSFSR